MGEVIEFDPIKQKLKRIIREAAEAAGLGLEKSFYEDIVIEGVLGSWDKKKILDHMGMFIGPEDKKKLESVVDAALSGASK